MYRPSYSLNDNPKNALKLIQDFPLGLLISNADGNIESNYLPFFAMQENDELILTTHLARSNPQWKTLGLKVLVSFQGPNRYISPEMYISKTNVPTWNYVAVQVEGAVEVITDGLQIKQILNQSVEFFEARNQSSWRYDLPPTMQKNLESAIVGLRVRAKGVAKFKLGQNRNDQDYEALIEYLKKSSLASDKEILDWMSRAPK